MLRIENNTDGETPFFATNSHLWILQSKFTSVDFSACCFPACLQTTIASYIPQLSEQIAPLCPLSSVTLTYPSLLLLPPTTSTL